MFFAYFNYFDHSGWHFSIVIMYFTKSTHRHKSRNHAEPGGKLDARIFTVLQCLTFHLPYNLENSMTYNITQPHM